MIASFKSVQIDTLFQDKISIRAILIDKNKFGTQQIILDLVFMIWIKIKNLKVHIIKDTLKLEFRSIAQTSKDIFI